MESAAERSDSARGTAAHWDLADFKRPAALLAGLAGIAVSAPASLLASCNAHEIGHALVATALGWRVERVNLCVASGGSVDYASIGTWAGNAQGYAGGLIAAIFLAVVYLVVFAIPRTPLRGPGWWAAGFGPALWIGPQLVIGFLEGGASPGQDYAELLRENLALYVPIIAATMVIGAAVHAWRWRAVGRRGRTSKRVR